MKIDAHAHIMPFHWPSLKDKFGYGGWIYMDIQTDGSSNMMRDDGTFFRNIKSNCWDPEEIIKDMNVHHVNAMVLSTVPVLFNYWAKPKDTFNWTTFLNEHIASVQNKYPSRFICLGSVPMQDVSIAIEGLKQCKHLGLPGVEIGTHIGDKNLDNVSFHPFWKCCEELDLAVFVHPWDMMGQEKMPNYFLPWLVGMPAETSLAICSMLFGGVFDNFPKLRVMFAHGGGSFPFTLGRISHGWHCRPDLCNVNKIKDPKEYIGKFWIDGITHNEDALRFLINLIGADKIMYGTDYPFPLGDLKHGKFIEEMQDISFETKEQLFSKSVLKWLKLPKERF